MATSVSKSITYSGINFSGSITSTISGNTVTVKYSINAGSTYEKVKVWLRGDWWYLVSSVPWSGTKTLTKTFTISGPTSFGVAMAIYHPDTDDWHANVIASTQLSQTPASYTVAYNANGGTGAPPSQTKYHGTAITLSAVKPTRTGYTFSKWATAANGTGTAYSPGASYTANATATLYAQWTANKYTVIFDANGGSGGPGTATKTYGSSMTIPASAPTKANHRFVGWAESNTATVAQYEAGGAYTKEITADTTLYAVWELAYYVPVVNDMNVSRCTQYVTIDDFGQYVLVGFSWECCQLISTNPVASIKIKYKSSTDTDYTEVPVEPNGTVSGTQLIGIGGSLSTDLDYTVTVEVTDTEGGVGTATKTVSVAAFPIDFLRGGKGVSFGKPAETEGLDVGFKAVFRGAADFFSRLASHATYRFVSSLKSSGGAEASSGEYSNALQLWDSDESDSFGSLQATKQTNGEGVLIEGHRTVGGADKYNTLRLLVNKDGTPVVSVSNGAAWRSGIGADNASNLTAGTTAIARGGTGQTSKLAAFKALGGWTKVAGITGTNSATINLSGYYEVMIVGWYSTTYIGSANFMVANFNTTQKEVYLGGGNKGTDGRRCAVKLSTTKITGVVMNIDSSIVTGSWNLYAR